MVITKMGTTITYNGSLGPKPYENIPFKEHCETPPLFVRQYRNFYTI